MFDECGTHSGVRMKVEFQPGYALDPVRIRLEVETADERTLMTLFHNASEDGYQIRILLQDDEAYVLDTTVNEHQANVRYQELHQGDAWYCVACSPSTKCNVCVHNEKLVEKLQTELKYKEAGAKELEVRLARETERADKADVNAAAAIAERDGAFEAHRLAEAEIAELRAKRRKPRDL